MFLSYWQSQSPLTQCCRYCSTYFLAALALHSVVTLARPRTSYLLQLTNPFFRYASPCLCNQPPICLFVKLIPVPISLFLTHLFLHLSLVRSPVLWTVDLMFCACFFFIFFPTHFFRRLQTDIFETFPHDVALLEKEALLCRFPKSAL